MVDDVAEQVTPESTTTPSTELFSRDEVLGGLSARRARRLLFLIESRTAHEEARSRDVLTPFHSERLEQERDLAFLEAFSLGRQPPLRPTIQHLEHHAAAWAPLVPTNPQVRATLAHLLGEKYRFAEQTVPALRSTLGLDEAGVARAYQRQFGQPLATIYAPRVTASDRVRWAWVALARKVESLPPFWTAYALTLTETVGAGILALPIAVASLGPLPAMLLLVVLGLLNVVTIACISEAVARNGLVRYQRAFFGRLVDDYLGGTGSLILTVAVATICVVALLAYYIGLATTLGEATPVPPEVWCALLFVVSLYVLSRETLSGTVASALAVGAWSIGVILILSLLGAMHLQPAYLLHARIPLLDGSPFDASIIRLIFGVVLLAYFGHLSVGNCARLVLHRDPSARSLIRGTVAAQATTIVLYCVWVLAVNGSVGPEALAGSTGTALSPLAAAIGPSVHVLGTIFVVPAMGMASIHISMALFNLVRERLPGRVRPRLVLARRQGRLVFGRGADNEHPTIRVTYLGLERGQPRFRVEVQQHAARQELELAGYRRLDIGQLLRQRSGEGASSVDLVVDVLEATDESASVQIEASLVPVHEGGWDARGLMLSELFSLSDADRRLVSWLVRNGEGTLAELSAASSQDDAATTARLDLLVQQGLVRVVGDAEQQRYRAVLAGRRGRQLPEKVWSALAEVDERQASKSRGRIWGGLMKLRDRAGVALLERRGRFLLSVTPVLAIFLFTEWLFLTGSESFSEPLSLGGVLAGSIAGGVFPILLLIASERKSDVALDTGPRPRRHVWIRAGIYAFFIASLLLHGLVIWEGPLERSLALLASVLILLATVNMVRRGAFRQRLVVELRQDAGSGESASLTVLRGGQPVAGTVSLSLEEGEDRRETAAHRIANLATLHGAELSLETEHAQELRVWAHRITPEGDSEGLPFVLQVRDGNEVGPIDLSLAGGQVVVPVATGCRLTVALHQAQPRP